MKKNGFSVNKTQNYSNFAAMRKIIIILLAIISAMPVIAQSKGKRFIHRVDSVLSNKYHKVAYDTMYISRPEGKLTLKVRVNLSGNEIKSKGKTDSGEIYKSNLKTDSRATLSVSASYMGVSAGLALNPAKLAGKDKDYEMNINAYSNMFGVDASYQASKTLSGTFKQGDRSVYLEEGEVDLEVMNISAQYVFNYKKFSYPAAFAQSMIQKRSAGSVLAGISYQGGRLKYPGDPEKGMPKLSMHVNNFALGVGYGYNWVVDKHWLFHLSVLPTLIVINRNRTDINDERRHENYNIREGIFNERIAIVYNINPRYFISATGIGTLMVYKKSETRFTQDKWLSHISFGMRL